MQCDGTSPIYFQYCYSAEKRTLLNTEIKIPSEFWNSKKRCIKNALPSNYGCANHLNDEVNRMLRIAEDLIRYALRNKIENPGFFVKKTFRPHFDVSSLPKGDEEKVKELVRQKLLKKDFYFQFDEYIKSKEKKVSKASITVFQNVKHHLKAYEESCGKRITFNSVDYDFYSNFVDFLTFEYVHRRKKTVIEGLRVNTIGKTIKQLRIFIRDRIRRKIIEPIDLNDFKIPEEEPDAIYLSYSEIGQIYHTDLSHYPELKKDRNLFVLACLTGLRFSDFSMLEPDDLRMGMLYKKQEKSDHWVVIPLRQEAKEIFTREFKASIPQVRNPDFNKNIKKIGKLAGFDQPIKFSFKKGNKNVIDVRPKYEWITSHTARRSFCTNEFLAGTPVKLIMNISGHKKEKDFYKYIRVTPEEAANKIKELWEKRDGMEVFKQPLRKVS
jgi:hypothetical protein